MRGQFVMRKFGKIALGTLGAVVGISVIASVANGGESTPAPAPAAPVTSAAAPAAPAPTFSAPPAAPVEQEAPAAVDSDVYTYEVFAKGGKGTAMISYVKDSNFNQSQETAAKLPWTKDVDMSGGYMNILTLTAQSGAGVKEIGCRIKQGDTVLVENSSAGQYAVVTCNHS